MPDFFFRRATLSDVERCFELICQAKRYMASLGRRQWNERYPAVGDIVSDISAGDGYVLCLNGGIVAYGAVIFSGEPLYGTIDGKWLSDGGYVVLHRLCVADVVRGTGVAQRYFGEVERFAASRDIRSFKVDTNFDNAGMLHILSKLGFSYCGEIHYPHGDRRAFEKIW